MLADVKDLNIDGWNLKFRQPAGDGPQPVIVLIHGWTGDEHSMWVFAPRLPKNALLIAPRAPYPSNHPEIAGYSWVQQRADGFSSLEMFDPAVGAFEDLLPKLAAHFPHADFDSFGMMGFSQGSAFSVAYAVRNAARLQRLAMLAGFLPEASEAALPALAGKPVFIAHGTQDQTVPVARAYAARDQLAAAGAQVRYCESEVGHKLGANCVSELAAFFLSDDQSTK
ncbi:MAG: dienelactone hydrolase family protein [Anaerolineales bacterium]|nr:dienelactone hydrolase family protein [Anaerolineales bacterium]